MSQPLEVEGGPRRREEIVVQIRKNKRQENIFKKRKEFHGQTPFPSIADAAPPCLVNIDQMQCIPTMTQRLLSDNLASQLEAATQICKLLLKGQIALIDEVIRAGVVPQLVKFLARDDIPPLQFVAAWTLTNIASGTSEHTRIVIKHGTVPLLVHLLCSSSADNCKEQAMWALGNIAGDCLSTRGLVLSHGTLLAIVDLLLNPSIVKISILKIASWTIFNLCRGKPPPKLGQIQPALPILGKLLLMTDEEVVLNICRSLFFLTHEGSREMIQAIIEANVCPPLIKLLRAPESRVIVPALKTIDKIASSDEVAHTKELINNGVLPCLKQLYTQRKNIILKELCCAISSITRNRIHIQAVIDVNLIGPLVRLTLTEFDIKEEIAWAISNATYGSVQQVRFLVDEGCIEALCDLLNSPDPTIIMVCLNGLDNILLAGEPYKDGRLGLSIYAQRIDDCGGVERFVSLQSYDNNDIYNKVVGILETYWPGEHVTVDIENLHSSDQG